MQSLKLDRPRLEIVIVGVALLAALALALLPGRMVVAPVLLAALGSGLLLVTTLPVGWRLLKRFQSLVLVPMIAAVVVAWVVAGLHVVSEIRSFSPVSDGQLLSPYTTIEGFADSAWPWDLGHVPVLWPALALIGLGGGLVLISDAVRVHIGLGRPPQSAWHSLTAKPTRFGRVAVRAIPGLALIGALVISGIGAIDGHFGSSTLPRLSWTAVLVLGSIVLIISPIAVGALLRVDFDKEATAREAERRRFAAHLHDSVLQTLALIQRQADDPAAVARLARRQEHALRVWMAGDVDLASATLAGAVRDTIEEVEDEEQLKVELTVIGDTALDRRDEELIAAMREALRNAARHAPGATVNVFLDISATRTELFVRDSGPGFVFDEVPPERRGLRDAIIGRMLSVSGSATVDSTLGEGTEIALRLPMKGANR